MLSPPSLSPLFSSSVELLSLPSPPEAGPASEVVLRDPTLKSVGGEGGGPQGGAPSTLFVGQNDNTHRGGSFAFLGAAMIIDEGRVRRWRPRGDHRVDTGKGWVHGR